VPWEVAVRDPLPVSLTRLLLQGFLSGPGLPTLPGDDPATARAGDAVLVPLGPRPWIEASLAAAVGRSRGPSSAAVVTWAATIRNRGAADASGVSLRVPVPAPARLVPGSLATSQGDAAGGDVVEATAGTVPAGGSVVVSFALDVDLPPGGLDLETQGRVAFAESAEPVLTDDPSTRRAHDPTRAVLRGAAALEAAMTDLLAVDADRDGPRGRATSSATWSRRRTAGRAPSGASC
jgi:hypothetical protein